MILEMDDMVAVDPKLFVTCRLCLEEMGQYQIIPSVQQQIKYCFDFDVKPFDGLPQLICANCKVVLVKYYNIKKTFIDKQSVLRSKLQNNGSVVLPLQDTVSSTQPQHEEQQTCQNEVHNIQQQQEEHRVSQKQEQENETKNIQKRAWLNTSTESDSDSDDSHFFRIRKMPKSVKNTVTWKKTYTKRIVCRLCDTSWQNKGCFDTHNRAHQALRSKYSDIMSRYCTVNLKKIDGKPNLTGQSNAVVHDNDKIIECGNCCYYILYSKNVSTVTTENVTKVQKYFDSSDDEEIITKRKHKRRRRLDSRSSLDRVVLETKSNKHVSDEDERENINNQCINIDDSSDTESNGEKSEPSKKPMEAKLQDFKTIHSIIRMCSVNYRKKRNEIESEFQPAHSEDQLKHIILSIGRKVLHSGFKCAGFLKYMEYKNLDINWIPNVNEPGSKDAKYIRILARDRAPTTSVTQQWTHTNKNNEVNTVTPVPTVASISINTDKETLMPNIVNVKSVEATEFLTSIPSSGNIVPTSIISDVSTWMPPIRVVTSSGVSSISEPPEHDTLLADCTIYSDASESKLLNSSPVPYPKQLPKKPLHESKCTKLFSNYNTSLVADDTDINMPIITTAPFLNVTDYNNVVFNENSNENNLPIITSSKSLADPHTKDGTNVTRVTSCPRIKVKPVTELMSERCLNNLRIEQQASTFSRSLLSHGNNSLINQAALLPGHFLMPSISHTPLTSAGSLQVSELPGGTVPDAKQSASAYASTAESKSVDRDYVILDTVELPNTKTNSPFTYLKNLLQIHNLILVSYKEILPQEFICIVKFKVEFKQESQDIPVTLGLSLLCLGNKFCLKVEEIKSNQAEIDVYKFSANWQWEILKVYTGNVLNKALENAERVGQETRDLTNKFLCLLKSIKLKSA